MRVRILLPPCLALLLLACDFYYGVSRTALIRSAPELECVRSVLAHTPGIESVHYQESEGGRPLTWTGVKPPTRVHSFVYEGDRIWAALRIFVEYSGKTTFTQSNVDVNRRPPQEVIDRTLPVMRAVERGLEAECGMARLAESIEQHCWRVDCTDG